MGPIIADRYALAPGCCHVCRTSKLPTWILEPDDDDENRLVHLYLCRDCVRDLARMMSTNPNFGHMVDFVVLTRGERAALDTRIAELEAEIVRQRDQVTAADALVTTLTAAHERMVVAGPPDDDPPPEDYPDAAKGKPRARAKVNA